MCCALLDSCPHISELSGVESRWSPAELITGIKGSRIRGGGKSELESESESELLQKCQNSVKSVEDQIRLLDSIFELKIIHAGEVAYMWSRVIRG